MSSRGWERNGNGILVVGQINSVTYSMTIQRIEKMFGKNCNDPKRVFPTKCRPSSLRDNGRRIEWPVEPAKDIHQGCWWPKLPGTFDNTPKHLAFARFLGNRLLHMVRLVLAYDNCL